MLGRLLSVVDLNALRTLLFPRNWHLDVDFSFYPDDDDIPGCTRAFIPADMFSGISLSNDDVPKRTFRGRTDGASSSSLLFPSSGPLAGHGVVSKGVFKGVTERLVDRPQYWRAVRIRTECGPKHDVVPSA